MVLPLSPSERQLAHQLLGITDRDLAAIESSALGEEQLKQLKQRVRRTFKELVPQYHPDRNGGDVEKARLFSLLVRATKEIYARQAKVEAPAPQPPRWKVRTVAVPVSGTREPMRANVRRPRGRPDPREQAARLGKMRP